MNRHDSMLFTPARIGPLTIANRWVRSGTADLSLWHHKRFTHEDVALYRELARSGIGLIVVCGPEVLTPEACAGDRLMTDTYSYEDIRAGGIGPLLAAMREEDPDVTIIAQLECNALISGGRPDLLQ